jgi:hypothetical protein
MKCFCPICKGQCDVCKTRGCGMCKACVKRKVPVCYDCATTYQNYVARMNAHNEEKSVSVDEKPELSMTFGWIVLALLVIVVMYLLALK